MAHENKPLSYEARVRDTKGVAQRVDLEYLRRPSRFRDLRRRLTWMAPAVALAAAAPFVLGIGKMEQVFSKKVFSNGPVARAHAVFESNCKVCHTAAFSRVPNQACLACHDGPSHPAKAVDTARLPQEPRCTACHVEHRGGELAAVADGNCTGCHSEKSRRVQVASFRPGRHPDFPARSRVDERPLRLNHAAHLPAQPKTIRGMKLPMRCADCHTTSAASPTGDFEPVTFEKHCRSCHRRELEFVLPGLPVEAPPAPHTKDAPAIRRFIAETYQGLVAANPSLVTRPLDRDLQPERSAAAWMAKASSRSEEYLFQNKCKYCHEFEPRSGELPAVRHVSPIRGRWVDPGPDGEPWLLRGEFSHRAHRAVACSSCHTTARASAKTADVLIPRMPACLPCHGPSGTRLDQCSQCHLYHNKLQERDRDRRPVEELIGGAL